MKELSRYIFLSIGAWHGKDELFFFVPFSLCPKQDSEWNVRRQAGLMERKSAHTICLFTENLGTEISCCWGRCHQFIGGKKLRSFFISTRWTLSETEHRSTKQMSFWVPLEWASYNIYDVSVAVPLAQNTLYI